MACTKEDYSFNNMSCRTTGNFSKKKNEGGDGRLSTTEECDSTTEPVNLKAQFQIGEDVYYQEDTGQNVLGSVGLIQGKKIKIIFMDGTEKWAPFSRIKKISMNFAEDEEEEKSDANFKPNSPAISETSTLGGSGSCGGGVSSGTGSASGKKKSKNEMNGHVATPKENYQVTCGSCGTQKMFAPKKAVEFSPYTAHQYNCRKCINKSKTNKNNGVPFLANHYLTAARVNRRADANGMASNKGIIEHGLANGMFSPAGDRICLHCRHPIVEQISLVCTMCERPCHSSCLALTPPPLPGDTFWSIICHVCGTQKQNGAPDNDSQKLYSSRRSITCWSDVALLLLSCLRCKHFPDKYFHLDEQIIPFWEENVTRLHLPRQYKTADPVERRRCLLVALKNAHLRFLKDEARDMWGIIEQQDLNLTIKPPLVSGGRAVNSAGFPISVRANNPEAASAAMTNIAQTIAANKAANNVPTPKNSPSHPQTKSVVSNANNLSAGRKSVKPNDQQNVAKKAGQEVNNGVQAQRAKNDVVSQSRSSSKNNFVSDLPKTGSNRIAGTPTTEILPSVVPSQPSQNYRNLQQQQQLPSTQMHNITLSPSPGGAARVTGMMISTSNNNSATPEAGNRMVNTGSYPVRKNGSPMLNKSIRVETVDRRKDVEGATNKNSTDCEGKESRNDSFGNFTPSNQLGDKLKRKISLKPNEGSSQDLSIAAKKLKIGLPSSTDVTSKRLPSPPKSVDCDVSSHKNGQKKAMSPLQKLSDLQRNGGLTVACLKHTETGFQTLPMTPSNLEQAIDSKNSSVIKVTENYSPEERSLVLSTPVKNSDGATPKSDVKSSSNAEEEKDNTKEKVCNVTTSPSSRVFKLASVSPPGSSKTTSPVSASIEKRVRPVRLKRNLSHTQNDLEKQTNESPTDVKPITKKLTAKGKAAALTAAAVKSTRGRPKSVQPLKLQLRKPNNRIVGYHGQFNGSASSVQIPDKTDGENDTIDEAEFSWNNARVKDLIDYGYGYRIGCLPKCPEGPNAKSEITQNALKHLREELAPRPPSYWSSTSNQSHGKKSSNQRSRRDLKDADSYYVLGRKIDQNGIQYQVVWRDGYGFEYTSEDEDELGLDLGENYLYFEDYDPKEYFRDKMPPSVSINGNCDSSNHESSKAAPVETENQVVRKDSSDSKSDERSKDDTSSTSLGSVGTSSAFVKIKIKPEPSDSDKLKSKCGSLAKSFSDGVSFGVQKSNNNETRNEPMIIDLTDSP